MGRDLLTPSIFRSTLAFQSTLPAWGETYSVGGFRIPRLISIHSPRMGRDDILDTLKKAGLYFNPLSPHGERLV